MSNLSDNLLSALQGASNAAASNVSGPVDALAWALRKVGVPVPSNPILGSEWLKQQGLIAEPKNRLAGLLGEGVGLAAPFAIAAKAPQIAGTMNKADDALAAGANRMADHFERTGAAYRYDPKQRGALFATEGLPDRGRDLIQSKAQELADQLRAKGFDATVEHSGSAAGPSSYLKVFDPQTGRYFDNVRLSGHSKGPFNSQFVDNVATDGEFAGVVNRAMEMRGQGPSKSMQRQQQIEQIASELKAQGVKARQAYKQANDAYDAALKGPR